MPKPRESRERCKHQWGKDPLLFEGWRCLLCSVRKPKPKAFMKPQPDKQGWEKRKSIGNYWLEVSTHKLGVILHHKDGRTWSDPARAMTHLMEEVRVLAKLLKEHRRIYA